MTAAPVTFILALALVGVGILTSDALTVIGCWVLVGAYVALVFTREKETRA